MNSTAERAERQAVMSLKIFAYRFIFSIVVKGQAYIASHLTQS